MGIKTCEGCLPEGSPRKGFHGECTDIPLRKYLKVMVAVILMASVLVACKGNGAETEPVPSSSPTYTASEQPVESNTPQPVNPDPSEKPKEEENPVVFYEKIYTINGRENHAYVLKIDISNEKTRVVPYLSFNKIYGYETLTDMVEKTGAYAGVNSGFFFEYGRPSGLVVIDGETVSPGTGRFESIIIEGGNIEFGVVETVVDFSIGEQTYAVQRFNQPREESDIAVYSPYYGNTDRSDLPRRYMTVRDMKVIEYGTVSSPVSIPEDGYLVTFPENFKFPENIKELLINIAVSPSFSDDAIAYEGASMLVANGESLAGDTMPWVGNLNHYDPRTCIGKFSDGSLGFVVIDGRQEGYSTGTTGRETADILLELGFTDAFMLDGGASSAMYYENGIVNKPSDGGIERILAGAMLIFID